MKRKFRKAQDGFKRKDDNLKIILATNTKQTTLKVKSCRVKTERKDLIYETKWGKICPHGQNERVMEQPTSMCGGCEFLDEKERGETC